MVNRQIEQLMEQTAATQQLAWIHIESIEDTCAGRKCRLCYVTITVSSRKNVLVCVSVCED